MKKKKKICLHQWVWMKKCPILLVALSYTINDNFNLNYNFAIDQNYKDLNYNEINAKANSTLFDFDDYLQEKKTHRK